jgi:hypothetical protein
MTLGSWFHQILFSDIVRWLSGVTKSWKMTYRGLAISDMSLAGLGQALLSHLLWFGDTGRWLTGAWLILAYDKPELARSGKSYSVIWWRGKSCCSCRVIICSILWIPLSGHFEIYPHDEEARVFARRSALFSSHSVCRVYPKVGGWQALSYPLPEPFRS